MASAGSAVVTGAAHPAGIGRAIVRKLAEDGYQVYALDLEHAEGFAGIEREVDGVRAFACDVTAPQQIQAVMEVVARSGGLDLLVNNAGIAAGDPDFEQLSELLSRLNSVSNVIEARRLRT